MSDHAKLYNTMVEALPEEAKNPKMGIAKKALEAEIAKAAKLTIDGAKHVSCARKARELVKSIKTTAQKKMAQISGRWFVTKV